ncbi:MAG: DUF4294 domain-containing protein [Paludibacteraceae bacterium]|nr:DUF4294 domain-containing protein [Paludibacteraceae bacterium]
MRLPLTYRLLTLLVALLFLPAVQAHHAQFAEVFVEENGDTLYLMPMLPTAYCYAPLKFKNRRAEKFYWKTVRDVKKCLPYARIVSRTLNEANAELAKMSTEKEKREYLKKLEKEVKAQYEPVVWKMTRSQGRMLIKLIDRETHITSYELLRMYRGKFTAFFYQGIARLFGENLKDRYDGNDRDKIIERVITLVEAGQL